jgi:hypothetical protein
MGFATSPPVAGGAGGLRAPVYYFLYGFFLGLRFIIPPGTGFFFSPFFIGMTISLVVTD